MNTALTILGAAAFFATGACVGAPDGGPAPLGEPCAFAVQRGAGAAVRRRKRRRASGENFWRAARAHGCRRRRIDAR